MKLGNSGQREVSYLRCSVGTIVTSNDQHCVSHHTALFQYFCTLQWHESRDCKMKERKEKSSCALCKCFVGLFLA